MTSLYELAGEYKLLSEKLDAADLDEQTVADTLEGASGDLQEKAVNVAKYAKSQDSDAEQIEIEAKAMLERAAAKRKKATKLREYLHDTLLLTGINKIESPWFVISIKNNPESVSVLDEQQIPRDYFKEIPATFKLDKTLVKQAIKDGFQIAGCSLVRGTRIEIK